MKDEFIFINAYSIIIAIIYYSNIRDVRNSRRKYVIYNYL